MEPLLAGKCSGRGVLNSATGSAVVGTASEPCRKSGTLLARNGTQFGAFHATHASGSEPKMPENKGKTETDPVIQLTMK
jgi:hypothetical protein